MTKDQLPVFNDEKQDIICNKCLAEAKKVKMDSDITIHTHKPDSVSSKAIRYPKYYTTEICILSLIVMTPSLLICLLIIYQTITHSESWNSKTKYHPLRYTLRESQFSPTQIEWGNKYVLPSTRFIFSAVIWEEWVLGSCFGAILMMTMIMVLLINIHMRGYFKARQLDDGENMGAGEKNVWC
ncbi:uncharacterized protein EAF01_002202 [Botrytis porri]|uniref:uncharacterized protein n=1 Tax=Botrytis porri TaxID=87229 RepID=UPI0019008E2F|nr:uncharacterized protein EAF01_002202 [Botrytis porri]KAF7910692.1 hypothetical protein EAF01_002202 [Botrytis porri]